MCKQYSKIPACAKQIFTIVRILIMPTKEIILIAKTIYTALAIRFCPDSEMASALSYYIVHFVIIMSTGNKNVHILTQKISAFLSYALISIDVDGCFTLHENFRFLFFLNAAAVLVQRRL